MVHNPSVSALDSISSSLLVQSSNSPLSLMVKVFFSSKWVLFQHTKKKVVMFLILKKADAPCSPLLYFSSPQEFLLLSVLSASICPSTTSNQAFSLTTTPKCCRQGYQSPSVNEILRTIPSAFCIYSFCFI